MSAHTQFLANIGQYPDFRDDPELALELVRKMQKGDKESESHLVASALKFIVELTAKHCWKWDAWQNQEDLLQEASQNVAARISKFNPKKATLEAYIRFCSRTAFIRFWYNQQTVHISESRRKILARITKTRQALVNQLGREPTLEEISQCVDLDEERVEQISSSPILLVNLDDSLDEEQSSKVVAFAKSSNAKSPLEQTELAEFRAIVVEAIGPIDTDLLLAYEDDGTAYFQDLYFTFYRKHIKDEAARKWAQRRRAKVRNFMRRRNHRPE